MKQRLTPYAKALYRTCTPTTERYALYAIPFSVAFFLLGTMFLGGIVFGANASLAGESLSTVLAPVSASQFQLWMDFATEDTLARVVFGLIYPIVAATFTAFTAGIHLGYAAPWLGWVVEGLNVLWPVAGIGLIVMQFIRFYELHRE